MKVTALAHSDRPRSSGHPTPWNVRRPALPFAGGRTFWAIHQRSRRYRNPKNLDFRNQARQNRLEELNLWRNAIAHQDLNPATLGATTLRLQMVREWRKACDRLAIAFDEVMRQYIESIVGASPW